MIPFTVFGCFAMFIYNVVFCVVLVALAFGSRPVIQIGLVVMVSLLVLVWLEAFLCFLAEKVWYSMKLKQAIKTGDKENIRVAKVEYDNYGNTTLLQLIGYPLASTGVVAVLGLIILPILLLVLLGEVLGGICKRLTIR